MRHGITPPPPNSGLGLANIFVRPEVKGLYYNGQSIALDGYSFIGCRFDNCNLHISSLNFDLIKCVVDQSTTISYGSSVIKVVKLFHSRHPWALQYFPGFVPTQNADGSITISELI